MAGSIDDLKKIFLNKSGARRATVLSYVLCTLISCVLAVVITYIFNRTGLTENEAFQDASDSLMNVSPFFPLLILLYCVVTPLFEEIIFRFLIFGLLYFFSEKAVLSVLITALLFGLYHGNPVQMLYGFLMGLVITWCYYRYRKLSLVFLMHAAANLVGLLYTLV